MFEKNNHKSSSETILQTLNPFLNKFTTESRQDLNFYLQKYPTLQLIEDGYTNKVFTMENKKNNEKLFCKIFINKNRKNEIQIRDVLKFPKIFCENNFFRVEEFIEHENVGIEEINEVVKELRRFHEIDARNLGVSSFSELCNVMIDKINHKRLLNTLYEKKQSRIHIGKVLEHILKQLPEIKKECLVHNDLYEENILKEKSTGKIFFVDFEYSCFGERELDLAGLIDNLKIDYKEFAKSVVKGKMRKIIKEEDIHEALQIYYDKKDIKKELEKIKEKEPYVHLFHILWSVENKKNNQMDFDFSKFVKYKSQLLKESLEYFKIKILDAGIFDQIEEFFAY